MNRSKRYSPEIRERAVRRVPKQQKEAWFAIVYHPVDSSQDQLYQRDFTPLG
jgi:hypothetical protein